MAAVDCRADAHARREEFGCQPPSSMKPGILFASILCSAMCACWQVAAQATADTVETIDVGGHALRVPPPAGGFRRCDGIDDTWDQAAQAAIPSTNRLLAAFGSPEDHAALVAGDFPNCDRQFSIQTVRAYEAIEVDEGTFAKCRRELRNGLESMQTRLNAEVTKLASAGNQKLTDTLGVDPELTISDPVMVGIFEDTERGLGFTMTTKIGVETGEGRLEHSNLTAAMVTSVNGRLVTLYSTVSCEGKASQSEAEAAVKAWRDVVVAANSRFEAPSNAVSSDGILRPATTGLAVAGLFGLFHWWKRRARAMPT